MGANLKQWQRLGRGTVGNFYGKRAWQRGREKASGRELGRSGQNYGTSTLAGIPEFPSILHRGHRGSLLHAHFTDHEEEA